MEKNKITIEIIELNDEEWEKETEGWDLWYKAWIRGFSKGNTIYLKKSAKFIFHESKLKLIAHELGHILGYKHSWLGIMAWHGLFRL